MRSIAAAQTVPIAGDIEANIAAHARLARAAAEERAQVLVFPELSLTGYELQLGERLAIGENDGRLEPLIDLAMLYRMTLVVGAPARIAERLYIAAFVIRSDSSVEIYTKHHLGAFPASANPGGRVPPAEATVFLPGQLDPILSVGGALAAVAICADTSHASHAQHAAWCGAKTYLTSSFIIPADFDADAKRLQSYASQHGMAVVLSNYGGPSGELPSAGRSSIWSDSGELLVQLDETGSGVAVAKETPTGWNAKAVMLDRQ